MQKQDRKPLEHLQCKADGIVFTATAYPATPELVNEQVQGTIHWQNVEFAMMEDYQKVITSQSTGGSANVIDFSQNTCYGFHQMVKKTTSVVW